MATVLIGAESRTSNKLIFDQFVEQIDASVRESKSLHCERTPNKISVYREPHPRLSLELEYDEGAGTVRMRRQKLGTVISDLHFPVDRQNQASLGQADYCRLARQALRPLMDAFE